MAIIRHIAPSHATVAQLAEGIVAQALLDVNYEIERLRTESNVPTPIMSSEALVSFNRDLERGFKTVRPEDGVPGTVAFEDVNYSAEAIKDDDVEHAPLTDTIGATFFTE